MYTLSQLKKLKKPELEKICRDMGLDSGRLNMRNIIAMILTEQGNYDDEINSVYKKQNDKDDHIKTLLAGERSYEVLNKLPASDLSNMIKRSKGTYAADLGLAEYKGRERKVRLIAMMIDHTKYFKRDMLYAYHEYFKKGMIGSSNVLFRELDFDYSSYLKCHLCFQINREVRTISLYLHHFCPKCHNILQYAFVDYYLPLYLLSCEIAEHYDVRFYMWQDLKLLL